MGLRGRLMLLVLLAVLPALGIIFYSTASERRIHTELVQKDALVLAETAATRLGQDVEGIRQVLLALAVLPDVRGEDPTACNRLLANLLTQYPHFGNLAVLRTDGTHFASALPFASGLSIADRPWFKQAVATRDFVAGEYQIGRVTKKATINFGFPLKADDGAVWRVLYVPLDLQWLNQQLAGEVLPVGAVLTVFDRKGTVLARSTEAEKWTGQRFPDAPLIQLVQAQARGITELQGLDGAWRIYAFTEAGGSTKAFHVAVGIPREIALAHVSARLRTDLLALFCVMLVALAAAWIGGRLFVVQPINKLITATDQLTGGNLSARVMTSGQSIELARLGHAFNVMAETLQQQTNEQKQAAAALRSSEAMLNETGRIAKIGGWAIDLEKGTLTWTREVYAIHEVEDGFRPTVERAINFYAPESRPIIQQAVAQAIHSGEPFDVELEVITAKGRRIWVQAIGHVLLVSGKAQSISGTFQDITERKQAEAELARERTLLRTLLDLLPDSIYVKDRDSRFMAANAACARDMGAASGGDLIGKTDADFYPPEKASVFRSDELQVLAGKPVVDKEEVHVAPDGTRRILLTTKVPLQNSDGHIVGLVGTSRDITKHKQAEAERNELAQQRQLALNAARLGWWHYDPITKIATWDDRYKEIFGVTGHQRPNEEILARMHPDDLPGVWAKVEAALNPVDPKPYAAEYRMNLPGGVVHWVEAFGLAIFEGEGAQRHAVSFVGTVQDITERKQVDAALHRLNEELEQRIKERTVQLEAANKELEAFSYSVSHDLRAPLRAVDGFSHALAQDCGDRLDAEGQDFLKRIRAATKRMGQLIDDMLTLSRISRAALHKQPVDVSALARSVISELQEAEPQRKVDVQIAEKLQAEADPNLLRIALENLLGNAWKFTAKTPQPRIEVGQIADAPAAPGTTFFVRDNGAGFDMAYADKLFGAFQRLHRQDEFPGTGIGLATVMRIIHRHGGSVRAEGAVDRGATFFFTLDPLNHALPSSCVVGESRNHED